MSKTCAARLTQLCPRVSATSSQRISSIDQTPCSPSRPRPRVPRPEPLHSSLVQPLSSGHNTPIRVNSAQFSTYNRKKQPQTPSRSQKTPKRFSVREHSESVNETRPNHPKYGHPINPDYNSSLKYSGAPKEQVEEQEVSMDAPMAVSLRKQFVDLSKELDRLHKSSTLPVQDVVTANYTKIKQMALHSVDSRSKGSSSASKKAQVQFVENLGGAFFALEGKGKDSPSAPGVNPALGETKGWRLPQVDGVRHQPAFASEPELRSDEVRHVAQQRLIEAEKKLMLEGQVDETQAEELKALIAKQESILAVLQDNLPIKSAFLPPHTFATQPNAEADGALSRDTMASVMVPQPVLREAVKKMNERNLLMAKKLGLKEKDVPRVHIPSEVQLSGQYNRILKKSHDLLKSTIKETGFGTLLQVASKQELRELVHGNARADDLEAMQMMDSYWTETMIETHDPNSLSERVVLPVASRDGRSDSHLPVALRQALSLVRQSFDQLREATVPSPTAYTLMMTTYSELGMPLRAAELFDEMRNSDDTVPDTTCYNVMIDILVNSNKINTACKLFEEMRDFARRFGHGEGPAPEPTHAKARRVQKLKQVAIRKARAQGIHHLELDDAGLTEIAEEYANLVVADKPDDLIARPDVVTYTTVIKALGRMGDKSGAMQIFNMMRKDQVRLNEYAWTAIINAMCRTGDFKAGLRLLYEMKQTGVQPTKVTYRAMVVSAGRDGQVTLALALLQQMQTSGLQLEPVLMANLIRSLAEAGTVPDALRLHQQMAHGRFGPNMAPSRATYNALLESIADPHAWARMTLPPAALATGLAIYQEALLLGIFPHPYAERNENGVLDLRPYTRGAVLFPIHFCLNLLIDNIPINPSATQNLIKHADKIASRKFDVKAVADEFAVNSPFGASEGQTPMYFPRIPVPRKGIMLVSSKELRKSWSAAPKPLPYQSGFKLRKRQGEDFDPIMEPEPLPTAQRDYVEKVLRSTRPWIHYNVVPHNPNVVVVPSNTLRFWMHEQRKRAGYKDETENPRYPKVHHNQGIAHNRSPLLNSSSPINSILPQSNKLESSSDDQAEGDEPSNMAKSVTLGDTMMQKVRSKIQSSSSDAEDTARETDKLVNDVLHQQLEQPKPKKMPLKALASLKILSKKLMDTKKK